MAIPYLRAWTISAAAGACLLMTACASDPKPAQPSVLDEPVDAFDAVAEPRRPGGHNNRDANTLSTDIERLQNARQAYRLEQERLRAETSRRQAECRAREGSREVPIQDGSGDASATYCQPASQNER